MKYNGSLDDYFEQKEMLRSQLEARALSLKEKREEVLKFVARFGAKASKASQAQSRLKSLNKMETIEVKALPLSATIRLPVPIRVGKVIARVENVNLGYENKTVLKNVNMVLQNGDHLAVVGLNGAGKSTFLKALALQLKPQSGIVEYGYQVTTGYYAQHVAESLNSSRNVIDEMISKAHPDVTRQEALNMAGSLLFSGDDIKKKISVLSGGEKSRVALGQILLQKAPCLILDEPTNHLDFQTVEALTQALMSYQGTVAVVSHDRSFIRRIGTKILEINHGHVSVYPGSYDEYVWSLERGVLSERKPANTENLEAPFKANALKERVAREGGNYKEIKKNLDKQMRQCEKNLSSTVEELKMLNQNLALLNEKIANGSGEEIPLAIKDLLVVQSRIDKLESDWLDLTEKKEKFETELKDLMT